MTKRDIVLKVAEQTGLRQLDAKRIIQKALDAVIVALSKGETVELRNFGIFKVKTRKSRTGRNPRTGEKVPVPSKRVVVFKSGLIMKRDVR